MFTQAITRTPCRALVDGISTSGLGKPFYPKALAQHGGVRSRLRTAVSPSPSCRRPRSFRIPCSSKTRAVHAALRHCDPSRRSQSSRRGRADRPVLADFYRHVERIVAPGTLEGGDVMAVDGHYYIGLSRRTNQPGARQLIAILERTG